MMYTTKGLIDLYASNPFKYDIGEKVMGYGSNIFMRTQFIFGTIVDRMHERDVNTYLVESGHERGFSGRLFEREIKPYDEKLVLEEIRRTIGDENARVLSLKIPYYHGVGVIIEEKGKEIFEQPLEGDYAGDDVDPYSLLESFKKLLIYLGWKPDLDRMFDDGENIIILNFIKDIKRGD